MYTIEVIVSVLILMSMIRGEERYEGDTIDLKSLR